MNSIKAVYKIPSIKQVVFVESSFEIKLDKDMPKEVYRKTLDEICEMNFRKERLFNEIPPDWSYRVVAENDFQDFITNFHKSSLEKDCQMNHTSQELEFLSMNILKNQEKDIEFPHDTDKTLCCIDEEDTIEVFI